MAPKQPDIKWYFRPAGGGSVQFSVAFHDHTNNVRGEYGSTFDQARVGEIVRILCAHAGLPEPWKKG